MDAGHLVPFIYFGIVVVAMIVSVVKKARRPPPGRASTQPQPERRLPAPVARRQPVPVAQPSAPMPGPMAGTADAAPMMPPVDVPMPHPAEVRKPRRRPRWASGRGALIQAVVAAEVLGKPRALRDEW